jgi:hypothetical protein
MLNRNRDFLKDDDNLYDIDPLQQTGTASGKSYTKKKETALN